MKETWWYEWQMVDCEKKNKNTGEIETRKVTVKVRDEGSLEELTEKFEDTLKLEIRETCSTYGTNICKLGN